MEHIKQSEIITLSGLTPPEIKAYRDANLTREKDWHKEGVIVLWTREAADKFLESLKKQEPKEVAGVVIRHCPNKNFIEVAVDGLKKPAFCGIRYYGKLKGKKVRLSMEVKDGIETLKFIP